VRLRQVHRVGRKACLNRGNLMAKLRLAYGMGVGFPRELRYFSASCVAPPTQGGAKPAALLIKGFD